MISDEMFIQIKSTLDNWCHEILNSDVYEEITPAYPGINVIEIITNIFKLGELKTISDVIVLAEEYEKNTKFIERNSRVSKIISLLTAIDKSIAFENKNQEMLKKIQIRQKELEEKLTELDYYDFGVIDSTFEKRKGNVVAISSNATEIVGLKKDGTVALSRKGYVTEWFDITAISAGVTNVVGLKKDGTIMVVGGNRYGQHKASNWTDIVAISAGTRHIVGLKKDGTIVAVGNNYYGQCEVSNWSDIVAISAGNEHTVGLKKDGTVVAVGDNYNRQCEVLGWTDIVAISAGEVHTVGLKKDGTVVAVGDNYNRQCEVSNWWNIVAISAGEYHTVGLTAYGYVEAVGAEWDEEFDEDEDDFVYDYGQCNVSGWSDIIAISAGARHTVGLKKDGTVVAVGEVEGDNIL